MGIALVSLKLWQIASLALPLVILLFVQTIFLAAFARFGVFRILGSNYDAAVITAAEGLATTAMYGGISDNGAIAVSATAPQAGPVLKAVEKTTMPDGQFAIKFQVLSV